MPRPAGKVPAYGLHKASGKAIVRIDGRDHYLGAYGSPESHERYEQLVAEWRTLRQEQATPTPASLGRPDCRSLTVNELILRYVQFAETYYTRDGKPTQELVEMKLALRPVRKLYGRSLASTFGPLALKAVRWDMIDTSDLSRGVVNRRVNRIKRVFKWAVSEEMVPAGSYEALRSVAGLRFGRTNARETEPVKPVPQAWVVATLPHVSRQVAAMIQVQQLAAMRPCEVVLMRACDIDMTGETWIYEPFDHKNRWRGHQRLIALGPRAQALVKPFLKLRTDEFLFNPREAEQERNAARRQQRQTPMTPSQSARSPKASPRKSPSDRYTVASYRRAISYGVKRVLATARTGLLSPDVFYFGNSIGETGNSTTNAMVNSADEALIRLNPRTVVVNLAPIDFRFDINRDKQVTSADQALARLNATSALSSLRLIAPSAEGAPAGSSIRIAAVDVAVATLASDSNELNAAITTRARRRRK